MSAVLELLELCVGYGDHAVVSDVTLTVREAEVVGIFGANGAGKSTILRAISRTAAVLSGSVSIKGRSVAGLRAHEISRLGVGIMPQGASIFPSLTVEENLLVAARRPGDARPRVAEAVQLFPEVRPWLGRPAALLSGGERQLVGLCRAFIGDPVLLLLDEPGAGLSASLLGAVYSRLKAAARERGQTILVVEQHATTALAAADVALVICGGHPVFLGATSRLSPGKLVDLMLGSRPSG